MQCAKLLSENFDGRVFLQPSPAPSEIVFEDTEWFLVNRYGNQGAQLAWREFIGTQLRALSNLAREFGPRFEVLEYPSAEILKSGIMPPGFSVQDAWHANAKYGALVLEQIDARREQMLRGD
jgi:hypothetical protein